ncbi:hypothetical protein [uncultured Desulfobulbus sp.]|uniref:hypothetical protein n=1 Tax=uncultured Desulfobulbus sp. TaxID=239745 RepID=UPI0029C899D6|nr:hypothetical protein [uncultured Desulfobulbus sp.]
MTEDLKCALSKEIEEARGFFDNPPPNEAATCDWVILPILHAIGYNKTDIIPQMGNAGNQFPDYTLLSNTAYTWYLEAKDWKINLDNIPAAAVQALNYANTQGHRWVVLSNGREWILFDNHIHGVLINERISARSDINSPDFIEFISALSKTSIQSDGLDLYARKWRLHNVLRKLLVTKDSSLIKNMQKVIKSETGLSNVQAVEIVQFFAAVFDISIETPPVGLSILQGGEAVNGDPKSSIYSLTELSDMGKKVWGHSVDKLYLPDGNQLDAKSWCDASVKIAEYIGNMNKLPTIPFKGLTNGKMWFINSSPFDDNGEKIRYRTLQIGNKELYLEINRSSDNFIKCLCSLCDASGIAKTGVKIRLTPK